MLISTRKNFLFIHIPKTAGYSLYKTLSPYGFESNRTPVRRITSWLPFKENPELAYFRGHSTAEVFRRKLDKDMFLRLHKFAVVRNPYDHAVSNYVFTQNNPKSRRNHAAQNWSFSRFLSYYERKTRIMPRHQSAWLVDRSGKIQVDQILFFENLKQDFDDLAGKLGLTGEIELLHDNKSPRSDYREYYTADLKHRVERLYAPDFEFFGYDFEVGLPTRNPLSG